MGISSIMIIIEKAKKKQIEHTQTHTQNKLKKMSIKDRLNSFQLSSSSSCCIRCYSIWLFSLMFFFGGEGKIETKWRKKNEKTWNYIMDKMMQ